MRNLLAFALITFFLTSCAENQPPSIPVLVYPPNDATVSANTLFLSWGCHDPESDILKYDVYLYSSFPYQYHQIAYGIEHNSCTLPVVVPGKQYYWFVTAHDSENNFITSPVWSFTAK